MGVSADFWEQQPAEEHSKKRLDVKESQGCGGRKRWMAAPLGGGGKAAHPWEFGGTRKQLEMLLCACKSLLDLLTIRIRHTQNTNQQIHTSSLRCQLCAPCSCCIWYWQCCRQQQQLYPRDNSVEGWTTGVDSVGCGGVKFWRTLAELHQQTSGNSSRPRSTARNAWMSKERAAATAVLQLR